MNTLHAGDIEVSYHNGFLRYLKVGQAEVLRMIYFAVRDANWGNLESCFYEEEIEEKEGSFLIKYKVKYTENSIDVLIWEVDVNGLSTNEMHFEIRGETFEILKLIELVFASCIQLKKQPEKKLK